MPSGIVYVPCAVTFTAAGKISATIAAEGAVTLNASGISVLPPRSDAPGIVSGRGVALVGADATVNGTVIAPAGAVTLTGARAAVRCGIVGSTVSVMGDSSKVTVDDKCGAA